MNNPRFHVDMPLAPGAELALPPGPARHVQVLRLQPGDTVTLFDGRGGQWQARVAAMRRNTVQVSVGAHESVEREAAQPVHLAVGLFALERMDWLVEKATELGAASLTPVQLARSNVAAARVVRRLARWHAISARACEQCGRNRLLHLHEPLSWPDFLVQAHAPTRWLLSPQADARPLVYPGALPRDPGGITVLSGPEGGLTAAEEDAAAAHGFQPVTLGSRILRAETAPLAVLASLLLPTLPATIAPGTPVHP